MSPRFVLVRENVPCVPEVLNRSLKADCTDFKDYCFITEIFDKFSFSGILRGCLSHLNEA